MKNNTPQRRIRLIAPLLIAVLAVAAGITQMQARQTTPSPSTALPIESDGEDQPREIDWEVPLLAGARSGDQYSITYTKSKPTGGTAWTELSFDDSRWRKGLGPIGSTGVGIPNASAPLGTAFADVNNGTYNVWFRRTFTLTDDLSDRDVWLTCGHDDEGAIYLDGVQLVAWGNEYNNALCLMLTAEQTALLTPGEHVLAVWAKNNSGAFYFDCGLYGCQGDEKSSPACSVEADFSTWEEYPLVKKIGLYQCPLTFKRWLRRDVPKLAELETRSMRYEMAWGKDNLYGQPAVQGTAAEPTCDYADIDFFFGGVVENCPQLIISQGYSPSIINNGDWQAPPADYDCWAKVNAQAARHWAEVGYRNHYIEVWNEPDLTGVFFTGTQEDYLKIYQYAAPAIREADPVVKVGGPAGASTAWHSALVKRAKAYGWPLDFLSGHAYGDPTSQLNTMRTNLTTLGNREAEMLISEYAPYTTGANTHAGGPVEKAEAAMTFFNALPKFLQYGDLTHVSWAQFIDAADMNAGTTLPFGHGDKMGAIDGNTGQRKALFNAFKLYGMMPATRCKATVSGEPIHVLASKNDDAVALVVWNTSLLGRTLQLDLTGLPFSQGHLKAYRIDTERGSYYETGSDELLPEAEHEVTMTEGKLSYQGLVKPKGVYFILLSKEAAPTVFPENNFATVVKTRQWYELRSDRAPYAYFDPKTWTARLSLNQTATGRAMVGIEAEDLPEYVRVEAKTSGEMKDTRTNSALCLRLDFQSEAGQYVSSVLFHGGLYKEENTFAPKWGTGRKPDEVVRVDNFGKFFFRLADYAPADFSGRVLVTFELASTGLHTKADIQLFRTDEATGIHGVAGTFASQPASSLVPEWAAEASLSDDAEGGNKASDAVYDLQGRRLMSGSAQGGNGHRLQRGIYIVGGKKILAR